MVASKMTLLKLLFFFTDYLSPKNLTFALPGLMPTPTAPQPWLLLLKSPILSISHFYPKPLSSWPHSVVVLLSFQALKKATRLKNLQRTLSKKVSEKPTSSIRKSKKTRQSTRFGHYHRGWMRHSSRMISAEPEEVPKPISGRRKPGQPGYFRVRPGTSEISMKSEKLPSVYTLNFTATGYTDGNSIKSI